MTVWEPYQQITVSCWVKDCWGTAFFTHSLKESQISEDLSRGWEVHTLEKSSNHLLSPGATMPVTGQSEPWAPRVHRGTGTELRLCILTPKMLHPNPATRTPVSRWIQNEKYSVKQLTSTEQCHKEKKRNVLEQRYLRDITFKCNKKSLTGSWVNTKHERNAKTKQLWQCQRSTLIFQ